MDDLHDSLPTNQSPWETTPFHVGNAFHVASQTRLVEPSFPPMKLDHFRSFQLDFMAQLLAAFLPLFHQL
jgi:hypothetical protein